ncbi:class I adenylate-forming enzyme family protein [Alicyclobacillus macrosporangiidus]|uniref:Long-chain acyl-CoA synthetase n=1 Tax=Alicyclobacillus macrosporangiidus TaxID=392015 RepID=A0A1I7L6C6_9BACL|nr:AMP-binding protein [Alicyclobacillus macrosporangiidus]SFV05277.1 long-chain acyl-CoA synthetase [Alicyclobacillus macrosporangiidus]
MRYTFADVMAAQANRFGDKPYLVWDIGQDAPRSLSFAGFHRAAGVVATFLHRLGVQQGDHVVAAVSNSPEMVVLYGAVTYLGAVVVPVNPGLAPEEMRYVIDHAEAKVVVADPVVLRALRQRGGLPRMAYWIPAVDDTEVVVEAGAEAEILRDAEAGAGPAGGCPHESPEGAGLTNAIRTVIERNELDDDLPPGADPETTAMILYTSGTTGRPKGAMLSHQGVLRTGQAICDFLGSTPEERILNLLPMTHCFSICVEILHALLSGGTLYLRSGRFAPRAVLGEIARHRITFICGVPSIFMVLNEALDRREFDVSSLRVGLVGGAPVPVETVREFEGKTGIIIVEGYGQTELSPLASLQPPHPDKRRLGSCGVPIPGTEVRIVDRAGHDVPVGETGELLVRGFNVMKGYWKQPEETAAAIEPDGWLHTGDVFRQDADGYLYMVDRLKDVIIYGGYNIYPKEVESVLYQHPAVEEAYVVGASDPLKGEVPVAFVRLDSGSDAKAVQPELEALCRQHLADYKRPRRYLFVDDFPRTPSGKVLRRELRERA